MRYFILILLGAIFAGCTSQRGGSSAGGSSDPDQSISDQAAEILRRGLGSSSESVRMHSIEAVRATYGKAWKDRIIGALNDDSPGVRFAAAMACGELRLRDAAGTLETLVNDHDERVKVGAIFALHRMGNTKYSELLLTTLQSPDADVRANTCMAMGEIETDSVIPPLVRVIHDSEARVRLQAAEALWRHGDMRGWNILTAAAQGLDTTAQAFAMIALAEGGSDKVSRTLVVDGLGSPDTIVRVAAARGLGLLGAKDGYSAAVRGTQDSEPKIRALAAIALGTIGDKAALPIVSRMMNEEDPDVRIGAAQATLMLLASSGAQ